MKLCVCKPHTYKWAGVALMVRVHPDKGKGPINPYHIDAPQLSVQCAPYAIPRDNCRSSRYTCTRRHTYYVQLCVLLARYEHAKRLRQARCAAFQSNSNETGRNGSGGLNQSQGGVRSSG